MQIKSPISIFQSSYDECGAVAAFHVDEILNDEKKREEVLKECMSADFENNKSIILFASPQAISEKVFWRKAIGDCIQHT